MKNIAIVTGASSGMGREMVLSLKNNVDVDEVWAISREKLTLKSLEKELDIPVRSFSLDLSSEDSILEIETLLKNEKPNVKLLVNAAGYGKFEKTTKISNKDNLGMIELNIRALTHMCLVTLPYMKKGSSIINFASVAAFQPVPYINIYAATKAYVLSFSRSLNQELKSDGIHVMAVCPYWTKTKFFDRAVTKNEVVKKYVVMYDAKKNIEKAWKDLKKKKDVSQYGFIAKGQVLLCKLLPHKLVMKVWLHQQKLK